MCSRDFSSSAISVIMPVHNGGLTLGRAMASLARQTFTEWELLAVDDFSTDASHAIMLDWAKRDARIRVLRSPTNQGPGAARNLALCEARGEFVAYLDCDDEYYPGYLAEVDRLRAVGDVLVFRYDADTGDRNAQQRLRAFDPALYRDRLFMVNAIATLAVAHRRGLIDRVGGFEELVWTEETWDLCKRFARTGAKFVFVPFTSGVCHAASGGSAQSPGPTAWQRTRLEDNRRLHGSMLPRYDAGRAHRTVESIVFAAPNSIIDHASGAAVAANDTMQLLARAGFRCEAFGSAMLDTREEICIEHTLAECGLPYNVAKLAVGGAPVRMLFTRKGNVPVTLFRNVFTQVGPTTPETDAFLAAFERFLAKNQPHAVLTFGNGALGRAMAALAKRRDIPVVFAVHNFAYDNPADFRHADYVTVPSRFSSEYYRQRLGLHCHVLPNVVDPTRVMASDRHPQYLTFVNPQPAKGLFVFARIADEIFRRRPDIPILVVESRGRGNALEQTGLDLSRAKNLFSMANTTDPRKFYRVTKLLIMPSVWNESFGLVAAEAMSNGIPVLASDRGSLPEVVADGGLLLKIPDRYTPETTDVPSADEVEPWVDAIVRLWDDAEFYRWQGQKAVMHARQWHPDRLRPVYVEFFRNLQPQPGPPIVPPPHTSAGGQSERRARSDRLEVIQVEPTTRCNFHCRFCAGRHLPQKDMTLDTFAHVLRSAHAVRHIRLQGEGEPLLCAGFFEMIEMAMSHHPEVRVSTITNGSLLSANADRLVESGLQHVSVSIDSADPELFDELRGGKLGPVVEGIGALLAARASRNLDRPAIGLAVTVLRRTIGQLPGIVALYERLGLDGGVGVQPLQEMPAYTRHYDEQMGKQIPSAADLADMNRVIAQDTTTMAVLRRPARGATFSQDFFVDWTPASRTCPWLEKGLYVAADGTAVACCFQKDAGRDGFGVFGRTSIEEILLRRGEWAEQHWQGILPAGCEGCSFAGNIVGRGG